MANDVRDSNTTCLRVRHLLSQAIGVVSAALSTFFTVITWGQSVPASLVLIAFAGLGVLVFALYGQTQMDSIAITQRSLLGQFRIAWDEVKEIDTDSMGNAIVFKGDDKKLVILGRPFWAGRDKAAMKAFLDEQIEDRRIPVRRTELATYAISRNVRVRQE